MPGFVSVTTVPPTTFDDVDAEAPASSIDEMARGAAMEVGLSTPASDSRAKNASRAAHRMIGRFNLKWTIPISNMEYKFGNQSLDLPYLSPIQIYKFFLAKYRELLFGGFTEDRDINMLLKSFWTEYRNNHPGHALFQDNGPDGEEAFAWTIPVTLYGDEGRGRRRGNTALVTVESPFGLNTFQNFWKGDHAFKNCDSCCPDSSLQQQHPCPHLCPSQVPMAAYASTNFKEHVFLSRVPIFLLPCATYKEHPDLIEFMMQTISNEFKQLYHEGLTIGGHTWKIALLGMKGDSKWLAQMGSLTRYYGKKGRKRSLAMCYECYAGLPRFPYEDMSPNPAWAGTLWRSRPWETEPCFMEIPFDRSQPERFLKRDLMHIGKLGIYRHHAASVIATLVNWKFFTWSGGRNDVPTQLQRAHGHFKLWCASSRKCPSLRSFTRALLNWKNKTTFPWLNIKASDATLVNQWIQEALLPSVLLEISDPRRKGLVEVMLGVSRSLSNVSQLLFSHKLFLTRRCSLQLLEHGTRVLNGYAWLAGEIAPMCAWAMIPKLHMFKHFMHDIKLFLESSAGQGCEHMFLSPLAFSNECNEDMIGKCCRLSRRVDARVMQRRVLELFLVKGKLLFNRWKKRTFLPKKGEASKATS